MSRAQLAETMRPYLWRNSPEPEELLAELADAGVIAAIDATGYVLAHGWEENLSILVEDLPVFE